MLILYHKRLTWGINLALQQPRQFSQCVDADAWSIAPFHAAAGNPIAHPLRHLGQLDSVTICQTTLEHGSIISGQGAHNDDILSIPWVPRIENFQPGTVGVRSCGCTTNGGCTAPWATLRLVTSCWGERQKSSLPAIANSKKPANGENQNAAENGQQTHAILEVPDRRIGQCWGAPRAPFRAGSE